MSDKNSELGRGSLSNSILMEKRLSRRNFLKGTTKLVTGVIVTRIAGEAEEAKPESKERVLRASVPATSSLDHSRDQEAGAIDRQEKLEVVKPIGLFNKVFGDLPQKEKVEARKMVDEMKAKIGKLDDYDSMLRFQASYEKHVSAVAGKFELSPQILMGMILIESGGDATKVSGAGAKGVAQIVDETAIIYSEKYQELFGEKINAKGDFRENPYLSTIIMAMYESDLKKKFGNNEGLAVLAYNWGEGTMMESLRVYFKDTMGVDIGDYETTLKDKTPVRRLAIEAAADKLVLAARLNVHQLLSNAAVQRDVISNLRKPEGSIYLYKTVAAAELFEN